MKNSQQLPGHTNSAAEETAAKNRRRNIGFLVALFFLCAFYSVALLVPKYLAHKKYAVEKTAKAEEKLENLEIKKSAPSYLEKIPDDLADLIYQPKQELPSSDAKNPVVNRTPITSVLPLLPPTEKTIEKTKAPLLPGFVNSALRAAEEKKGPLGEMARAYVRGASDLRSGETILFQKAKTKNAIGFVDEIIGRGPAAQCGSIVTLRYRVLAYDMAPLYGYPDSAAPIHLQLGRDIIVTGFAEGLIGTRAGGKRHISVPAAFAYQDKRFGQNIVPDATPLTYDVSILKVEETIPLPSEWYVLDAEEGEGISALCGMEVEFLYRLTGNTNWNGPYKTQLGAREIPFAMELALLHMREGGVRRAFISPAITKTSSKNALITLPLDKTAEIYLQLNKADWEITPETASVTREKNDQ